MLLALTPKPPTEEEIEQMVEEGIRKEGKGLGVEVSGVRNSQKIKYISSVKAPTFREASEKIKSSTAFSYLTGLSASAFTKLIIDGRIIKSGVVPPERLDKQARRDFLKNLSSVGIITNTTREILD